jgi:hypothetical protein
MSIQHPDGIYHNLPEAEYRADSAYSYSQVKKADPTMVDYRYAMDNPEPANKWMGVGTLVDRIVLENKNDKPELFEGFAIKPPGRAPNGWADQMEEKGLIVISEKDIENAKGCANSLLSHGLAKKLLRGPGGHSAVSMFYTRPDGVRLKGRIDRVPKASSALVDLKKTQDCEPGRWCVSKDGVEYYQQSRWAFEIEKRWYHAQAGIYLHLWNHLCDRDSRRRDWLHVCVEESPPHKVQVFQMEEDQIAAGLELFNRTLNRILECEKAGVWPGYEQKIDVVGMTRRVA